MTINWQDSKIFRARVSPEQSDIDGLGHTNNAVYVRWCEQVAWQHTEALGVSLKDYIKIDRAMAIVKANYEYLAASYPGEALELHTCLSVCDMRTHSEREFQLIRLSDGAVIFKATWHFRCIEVSTGKIKRMPPLFKEVYGAACAGIVMESAAEENIK